MIICRAPTTEVPDDLREKIALFCDVALEAVIPAPTAETIYEVPLQFHDRGLDDLIVRELGLEEKSHTADLTAWRELVDLIKRPKPQLEVALVGQVHRAARRVHVSHGGAPPRRLGGRPLDRRALGRL